MQERLELEFDYPSVVAEKLVNGKIDIGLVPVSIITQLNPHYIITDYCIGCNGTVDSVCLFSHVPLAEMEIVYLDYQSRTSVELLKVLAKEHWHIQPQFVNTSAGFEDKVEGNNAALIIGDRAFMQKEKSTYCYDLGLAWKEMTGLPFVFAAWVANKQLPDDFIRGFNAANAYGLQRLDEVIAANPTNITDLNIYYRKKIDYNLDKAKKESLNLFLSKI